MNNRLYQKMFLILCSLLGITLCICVSQISEAAEQSLVSRSHSLFIWGSKHNEFSVEAAEYFRRFSKLNEHQRQSESKRLIAKLEEVDRTIDEAGCNDNIHKTISQIRKQLESHHPDPAVLSDPENLMAALQSSFILCVYEKYSLASKNEYYLLGGTIALIRSIFKIIETSSEVTSPSAGDAEILNNIDRVAMLSSLLQRKETPGKVKRNIETLIRISNTHRNIDTMTEKTRDEIRWSVQGIHDAYFNR
ncbi:MAG: hypothetical protein HQ552_02245 [Desulfobacteraceae bacterium]|nr:hypothetical protein [Desulfobacteraceae bacterium]